MDELLDRALANPSPEALRFLLTALASDLVASANRQREVNEYLAGKVQELIDHANASKGRLDALAEGYRQHGGEIDTILGVLADLVDEHDAHMRQPHGAGPLPPELR